MSSVFQVSGTVDSTNSTNTGGGNTTQSDILQFGNPTDYITNVSPSGSKCIVSEITVGGASTSTTVDPLIKIQIPMQSGTNWNLDLCIRGWSNTNCTLSDLVVMKPTSDSTSWYQISRQGYFTDQTKLMLPVVTLDQSNKVIAIKQIASTTDDGPSYYTVKYSFTSGNNVNIGIPTFFL
jgi:hypothetical protein